MSDEISDGNPQTLAALPCFDIFISYRVQSDQALAKALQHLIETSIRPTPRVFVSGSGGIRPSSTGFKPQIQAAVSSARAFVAVITRESKDREWMFFEAGAAWGRNQLYCPLLIDTTTSDLPNSIADYQATRADDG